MRLISSSIRPSTRWRELEARKYLCDIQQLVEAILPGSKFSISRIPNLQSADFTNAD